MSTDRLAQPNPLPEGLLAHARKVAKLARRPTDTANGNFLIEKTEERYTFAITAFETKKRTYEANAARAELELFRTETGFILNSAPLLLERSAFRKTFDALAASKKVGQFFNGTDDVDEVVSLARRRMANRDRLSAADDATTAATCMLWRAGREEETIALYNKFTDVLVREIATSISKGDLYLVEARSKVARRRLSLTGRKAEAGQLLATVSDALNTRLVSNQSAS
jgi:hypothetical protein